MTEVFVAFSSCDAWLVIFSVALCFLGLALTFCGHLLYRRAFRVFVGVLAFAAQAAIGSSWLRASSGAQVGKKIVISCCCVLWAFTARSAAPKLKQFVDLFLEALLGAVLGIVLVAVLIDLIRDPITQTLGPDYAGWDGYAFLTIGIPVALLLACHSSGCTKLFLVINSALLGAMLATDAVAAFAVCLDANEPLIGAPSVLLLAMLGTLVQWMLE